MQKRTARRKHKFKSPIFPAKILDKRTKAARYRKNRKYKTVFEGVLSALKIGLLIGILSVGIYFLYKAIFVSKYFRVSGVEVVGASKFVSKVDLAKVAEEQLLNKKIFLVDPTKVEETLLRTFLGARQIDIDRKISGLVVITVEERVPLVLITNSNTFDYYMIDEDGYVLGKVDDERTNLPKVNYESEIKVGGFITTDLIPLYREMVDAIDKTPISVSSMSFHPGFTVVYLEDGIQLLIGNYKDKLNSIKVALGIVNQSASENKEVKKVDLRYDKVIVSY